MDVVLVPDLQLQTFLDLLNLHSKVDNRNDKSVLFRHIKKGHGYILYIIHNTMVVGRGWGVGWLFGEKY